MGGKIVCTPGEHRVLEDNTNTTLTAVQNPLERSLHSRQRQPSWRGRCTTRTFRIYSSMAHRGLVRHPQYWHLLESCMDRI